MKAFVARNHNGTLVGWNADIGELMEDTMVYSEITGNPTYINEEEFAVKPSTQPLERSHT